MQRIQRILVPTDFSPTASRVYKYAHQFCETLGAELIALHVVAPVHYLEPADSALLMREAREVAEKSMRQLKPAPARSVVKEGAPHDVIVTVAVAVAADLIVMGTHGRSGLQ